MGHKAFWCLPFGFPSNEKRGKHRSAASVKRKPRCSWHIKGCFGGYEFLYSLMQQYPDIWEGILENRSKDVIMCVPSSMSLGTTLSRAEAEGHVVYRSDDPNQSKVHILGNEVVTSDGFDIYRNVKIIMNEELEVITWSHEDEEGMDRVIESDSSSAVNIKGKGGSDISKPPKKTVTTIQVLHLSRPLVGGVDAPDSSEEIAEATVPLYMAEISAHPETEAALQDMDTFILEVCRLASLNPGGLFDIQPSLQACVRHQWCRMIGAVLQQRQYGFLGMTNVTNQMNNCIHEPVMSWLVEVYKDDDKVFGEALQLLSERDQREMGIKEEHFCSLDNAAIALTKATKATTPLMALLHVQYAIRSIQDTISLRNSPESSSASEFTTDDMVLLLATAIVQTQISGLLTTVRYIRAFHFLPLDTSSLGFVFDTLIVALDWLLGYVGWHIDIGEGNDTSAAIVLVPLDSGKTKAGK